MPSHPPESEAVPEAGSAAQATDFQSLKEDLSAAPRPPRGKPLATDFGSLTADMRAPQKRWQRLTLTDGLIDFFTPFMILIMVASVIFFLLDVRFVYTEVHDANLRMVAFLFVMGVVALNRLIAREGKEESVAYFFGLAGVIGLYTLVTTGSYDVGSFMGEMGSAGRNLMRHPLMATAVNMVLVVFVWWFTNRLVHECCVDENLTAGDIGILTGTARRLLKASRPVEGAVASKRARGPHPWLDLRPVDPTEWEAPAAAPPPQVAAADRPLPKRHPGVSIFYFSIPSVIIFSLGPRVIQHGGDWLVISGYFYLGCYAFSALMLLMLTSLGGLRAYFRGRRIEIPRGIAPFWLALGLLMVFSVLLAAAALPRPALPPLVHVAEHQYDPWKPGSTFRLQSVAATPVEIIQQNRLLDRLGMVVLVFLGLVALFGLLRLVGAAAFAAARRRRAFPPWMVRAFDAIDRLLVRLARWPTLPTFRRAVRIDRGVALCARFRNPLSDPAMQRVDRVRDVVETSYAALCALAEDLGVPRLAGQTPYEFVATFPKPLDSLRGEALELTDIYVRAAYSDAPLDEQTLNRVRKFWHNFERVRSRILR